VRDREPLASVCHAASVTLSAMTVSSGDIRGFCVDSRRVIVTRAVRIDRRSEQIAPGPASGMDKAGG
jgi:hypothetical protein